MPFH